MPRKIIWRMLAVALLLAGCQPVATATPIPTPQVWQVHYTPALRWIGAEMSACAAVQPGMSIVVLEEPAQALSGSGRDFNLRWGSPPDVPGYAAVVGYDTLAVIVHPNNPLDTVTVQELAQIYAGEIRSWNQFNAENAPVTGRIRLWAYPEGDDTGQVFTALTGGTEVHDAQVFLAPDPEAMVQAVSEDPSAVGFIPARWSNNAVRVVPVAGIDAETLQQPVVAMTGAEPQGAQRAWLVCLQERLEP